VSEKRAKELRLEVAFTVKIVVFRNGDVNVQGFPTDLDAALDIFHTAEKAVVAHFLKAATGDVPQVIVPEKRIILQS